MAVKERKQITGTTAQINAYKGHEGQIVWDKEKKTFVGMSGTAGKNYPLAPKEYVDNEVAKKQPQGDYATNAKLTEGLAGKEDSGVCLPLTGGVMVGDIKSDSDRPELFIGHDYTKKQGAILALRSYNHPESDLKGTFSLAAITPEQETWLVGEPDGDLWWANSNVTSVIGCGVGWFRLNFGVQICWGGAVIPANSINTIVNLPVPFVEAVYSVFTEYTDAENVATVSTASSSFTPNSFKVTAANPSISWDRWVNWVAIGYWK